MHTKSTIYDQTSIDCWDLVRSNKKLQKQLTTCNRKHHQPLATMDDVISMNLGGNKMVLRDNGTWALQSSDLDTASFEIEKLVEEKEALAASVVQCLDQIEALRKEVVEVNTMKSVILEMVRESSLHNCAILHVYVKPFLLLVTRS